MPFRESFIVLQVGLHNIALVLELGNEDSLFVLFAKLGLAMPNHLVPMALPPSHVLVPGVLKTHKGRQLILHCVCVLDTVKVPDKPNQL